MPTPSFPGGRIEVAPHVHNARYSCPADPSRRDTFQYIAGYEECDGHYRVARNSYPYLILEMVISGSGRLRIGKAEHEVSAGFCFCGGPELDYEFASSADSPIRKYFIVFGKTQAGNVAPKKFLYPGFTTPFAIPEELEKWNELIIAEGVSQAPDALENISALIGILVRKIAPDASGKSKRQSTDALVIKALAEIEQNFKSHSSLQDLAEALSVSSEHLCRVFKSNGKASPYRILIRRKMEHAYAQLKMTQTPIQEIAYSLGFTDSFHFSRAFKKRYGLPPSNVR
ncbi:AraC family transcriptional regulator [Pelagicoccus sp. SDUM812005]|uniref:helix-turn-helix transcriptional regulator n=1 Tax=Pelagicoccus sp. SDUM812005 TaxID=3041257 RepID=UPI00280DAF23|nr:AraC family transcriptional regulator [Pelagicoccus sp. SDUM812005]MDQ8183507.1 AraC family transcriptional regulator [Pelagicoccus sp. SDUM812005]